ncbi:MAG: tRNA (pseudouridine(54)-N(1))-methyltransferase TrmY [Candidatus Thermoplasmatota archaeon]
MRCFVIVAHRIPPRGDFSLNDLCGSGGRVDVIARAVTAALLLSNDVRRDVEVRIALSNPEGSRLLRFVGSSIRYLSADERSTAALVRNALLRCPSKGETMASPGLYVSRGGIEEALVGAETIVLLEEGATEPEWRALCDPTFVLSDDLGFSERERELLRPLCTMRAGLGPLPLHTDHCIAIVNHMMDMARQSACP